MERATRQDIGIFVRSHAGLNTAAKHTRQRRGAPRCARYHRPMIDHKAEATQRLRRLIDRADGLAHDMYLVDRAKMNTYYRDALIGDGRPRRRVRHKPVYRNFSLRLALINLGIGMMPWHQNVAGRRSEGYAALRHRAISVDPKGDEPVITAIHEIAHIVLHPAGLGRAPGINSFCEAEAHMTAYLVKRWLGVKTNLFDDRRYIRHAIRNAHPHRLDKSDLIEAAYIIAKAGRTRPWGNARDMP